MPTHKKDVSYFFLAYLFKRPFENYFVFLGAMPKPS